MGFSDEPSTIGTSHSDTEDQGLTGEDVKSEGAQDVTDTGGGLVTHVSSVRTVGYMSDIGCGVALLDTLRDVLRDEEGLLLSLSLDVARSFLRL